MRDEAPVYYSERWDFYALTRNEDVVAAHRDWETFSSAYGVTLDALSMRHRFDELKMLILMDPPNTNCSASWSARSSPRRRSPTWSR